MTTTEAITPEQADLMLQEIEENSAFWMGEYLGVQYYQKQLDIIDSVRIHRRTSVVGCNSSGKDFTTGRIILWWLAWHADAIVIVIGPTGRQVSDIVWKEARTGYVQSIGPLDGQMYETSRYEISDRRFAIGFATDKASNILGFHSPHLLVIVTEAHNVEQQYLDAVKKLNPERILLTGNPLADSGEFFDSHHTLRSLYNTIQISAYDTPNIQQQREVIPGMVMQADIDERLEEWGEDSPMYQASILGVFPSNLDDVLVSLSAATRAVDRTLDADPMEKSSLGVDVARFGADNSVIYHRVGGIARMVYKVNGRDTMVIAGKTAQLGVELGVDRAVIDDDGVGGGVVDRLKELRMPFRIQRFVNGAKASADLQKDGRADKKKRFFNAAAEAWWAMREAFQADAMDIDNNRALIGQITSRRYIIQSDTSIRLEPKDDYKKRTSRSPDDADALAMTFAPWQGKPSVRFMGG
jgi:phage terminase large subunit